MTTDENPAATAVAGYIAEMRAEAAEKKPHARYLETLLAADYDDLDDVPVPNGVSARIAMAMIDDVAWLKKPNDRIPFGKAYCWQRVQDRRSATKRAANTGHWQLP